MSTARATGTRTACARYSTAMTSTNPANRIHAATDCSNASVMPSPASQPGHAVAKRVRIEKRSSERRSLECSSESIAPLRSLPERRGDCRVGDRRHHDSSTEVRAVAGVSSARTSAP